jgi:hypothetical protein
LEAYRAWKESQQVAARKEIIETKKEVRKKEKREKQAKEVVGAVVTSAVSETVKKMSVVPIAGGGGGGGGSAPSNDNDDQHYEPRKSFEKSEAFLNEFVKKASFDEAAAATAASPVPTPGPTPRGEENNEEPAARLQPPRVKEEQSKVIREDLELEESVVIESARMLRSIMHEEIKDRAEDEVKEETTPVKKALQAGWPAVLDDAATLNLIPDLPDTPEEVFAQAKATGKLMVRVVTWNQQAKNPPPPMFLRQHLFLHNKFHVISIGTEECENTIAKSIVNTSKKKWEECVQEALGDHYVKIRGHTLQATNNMVMVHRGVVDFISSLDSAASKCRVIFFFTVVSLLNHYTNSSLLLSRHRSR